jgi:hypothetical protein
VMKEEMEEIVSNRDRSIYRFDEIVLGDYVQSLFQLLAKVCGLPIDTCSLKWSHTSQLYDRQLRYSLRQV